MLPLMSSLLRASLLLASLLQADGFAMMRAAQKHFAMLAPAATLEAPAATLEAPAATLEALYPSIPTIVELPSSATDAPARCGIESTQRFSSADAGCEWTETADTVAVALTLQGLRGQPAGCLAMHLATSRDAEWRGRGTATVTAFGRIVWSAVLRGSILVDECSVESEDGAHMLPVLRVTARKRPGAPSWDGVIEEGEVAPLM